MMREELHIEKRVLQINKLYYPVIGGIEKVVQQIAEGLNVETEMEMSVLTCAEEKHFVTEKINGVQVYRVPSLFKVGSLPIPFGLIWKLRSLKKKQDILHLHMPFPFGDLACLLSGFQGRIVLWWHSDVVRQKKMMILYKPIMTRILKRADKIVVATEGHIEGSMYLKAFRKKCVIVPFGVDEKIEGYADKYIAEAEGKEKTICSCRQKPLRFLFVGRFVYYKGCDILIRAFTEVQNAELIMVGSGAMEGECRKLAQEFAQENRIQFLGEVSEEELCRQFAACDVFVLPSVARSEAFGIVQIEAMAFGKPVINTKLPSGVPYVSLHGVTGLTVPPGDIEELAKAMRWMTEHEEERLEMGKQARKRMKEEYRMKTMLKQLAELYCSL